MKSWRTNIHLYSRAFNSDTNASVVGNFLDKDLEYVDSPSACDGLQHDKDSMLTLYNKLAMKLYDDVAGTGAATGKEMAIDHHIAAVIEWYESHTEEWENLEETGDKDEDVDSMAEALMWMPKLTDPSLWSVRMLVS